MARPPAYGLGLAVAALSACREEAQGIPVPSGQAVTFHEMIAGESGPVRFRFVAPEIAREGGTIGFDRAAADMAHLCRHYALPRLEGQDAHKVIISLSDREIAFGTSDPSVTQFFEAYRIDDGACIGELY